VGTKKQTTPRSRTQGGTRPVVGRPDGRYHRALMRNRLRRSALLLVIPVAVMAAGVWFALRTGPLAPLPPAGPSRADFDRLRDGMTLTEVEAVLGPAGGDYSSQTYRSYYIWKGPDGWGRVWLAGTPRTVRRLEFDPTLTD